jgi:hypothetical protein
MKGISFVTTHEVRNNLAKLIVPSLILTSKSNGAFTTTVLNVAVPLLYASLCTGFAFVVCREGAVPHHHGQGFYFVLLHAKFMLLYSPLHIFLHEATNISLLSWRALS